MYKIYFFFLEEHWVQTEDGYILGNMEIYIIFHLSNCMLILLMKKKVILNLYFGISFPKKKEEKSYLQFKSGLHRIPHGKDQTPGGDRPVVFLQHALITSSALWSFGPPKKSLAYVLADQVVLSGS